MLHTVVFKYIDYLGGNTMNAFTENAKNRTINGTTTENGAYALSTTGTKLLDLYGSIGGLRDADDKRVFNMLEAALAEDKLLATKIIFYARDVREGVGERDLPRRMLRYLAFNHPEMVKPNIKLMGEYGRYDDLYSLVGTPLEKDIWAFMRSQLIEDWNNMNADKPVSLLAKWIKTVDASSPKTRKLGIETAINLGYGDTIPTYKRCIRKLRKYIDIVERKMSCGEWSNIQYDKVPSRASLVHRNAFMRHDEERYKEYISKAINGEAKINTGAVTPYDLVHQVIDQRDFGTYDDEDGTVEAMWQQLPDYVNTDTNILCVVDTSGSMDGRPIEVALGLGLYFAEHNKGDYKDLFITFSSKPAFQAIRGDSLCEKLKSMGRDWWGNNTNLISAFKLILDHALQHHVPEKDMPKAIIVISDMEIDSCTEESYIYSTAIEDIQEQFDEYGYKLPDIVFWNVASRNNVFHADADRRNVQLASGESPAIFKSVIECLGFTPFESMMKVLNSERYRAITVE